MRGKKQQKKKSPYIFPTYAMFSFGIGSWEKLNIKGALNSNSFDKYGAAHSVTELDIGKSVTRINEYAFSDGVADGVESQLQFVTLPETNIHICRHAFNNCSNMQSIYIQKNVSFDIEEDAGKMYDVSPFRGCKSLMSIPVDPNHKKYKSENGMLLTKDGTGLICGAAGGDTVYIPDGVRVIHPCAFDHYEYLENVIIPNTVEKLGTSAFHTCSNLQTINIPDSMTSIGFAAFYGCRKLMSMTIPNTVKDIMPHAFRNCSGLTSMTIGNGVTSIGDFAFYGCSGLTSVSIDRPKADVQAMYPGNWGLKRGTVIHCNDGDIRI